MEASFLPSGAAQILQRSHVEITVQALGFSEVEGGSQRRVPFAVSGWGPQTLRPLFWLLFEILSVPANLMFIGHGVLVILMQAFALRGKIAQQRPKDLGLEGVNERGEDKEAHDLVFRKAS